MVESCQPEMRITLLIAGLIFFAAGVYYHPKRRANRRFQVALFMRVSCVRVTTRRLMVTVAAVAVALWLICPGRPLDPVAWQDTSQVKQGVRLPMADWLVFWGTLRGKTRSDVANLLGKPSDTQQFPTWDVVYWLGPERGYFGFLIDSEWLVLRLGQDGRVIDSRIVRD
jgi:hypothetical protein